MSFSPVLKIGISNLGALPMQRSMGVCAMQADPAGLASASWTAWLAALTLTAFLQVALSTGDCGGFGRSRVHRETPGDAGGRRLNGAGTSCSSVLRSRNPIWPASREVRFHAGVRDLRFGVPCRGCLRLGQADQSCTPLVSAPSITRFVPMVKLDAGLARKTMPLPISSGVAMRPVGFSDSACLNSSGTFCSM